MQAATSIPTSPIHRRHHPPTEKFMASTQISPYEQARLDKIKRNEERLKSLGLFDIKKNMRPRRAATQKKNKTAAPSTPSAPKRATLHRKARTITPSPPSPTAPKRTLRKRKPEPALSNEKIDPPTKKGRGSYKCGRCGVPKVGHICTAKNKKATYGPYPKNLCSHKGCTNYAKMGGICIRHGGKQTRRICSAKGCTNYVIKAGVCKRHGANLLITRKRCIRRGCNTFAVKGGICQRHGAVRIRKACITEGCNNIAMKGGVCWSHGAGSWYRGEDIIL